MLLPARSNRCMRKVKATWSLAGDQIQKCLRFPLCFVLHPPAGNTGSARARASVFVTESIGVHEVIGILQLFLKSKITGLSHILQNVQIPLSPIFVSLTSFHFFSNTFCTRSLLCLGEKSESWHRTGVSVKAADQNGDSQLDNFLPFLFLKQNYEVVLQ